MPGAVVSLAVMASPARAVTVTMGQVDADGLAVVLGAQNEFRRRDELRPVLGVGDHHHADRSFGSGLPAHATKGRLLQ